MGIKVITPAAQVISTANLRLNSRADPAETTEDGLFVGWLAAAVSMAEHYTGRSIGEQTLERALDAFPDGPIELPQGPVTSITSISYVDPAGTTQVLSNTLYVLDDYGLKAWALAKTGTEWPATEASANSVKVRYVAGDLNPAVITALNLLVANYFENREANTPIEQIPVPFGVTSLLNTAKIWGM